MNNCGTECNLSSNIVAEEQADFFDIISLSLSLSLFTVFGGCQRRSAMAEQEHPAKKPPAAAALHSHFMVGLVSEENSEDEIPLKLAHLLDEEKERSLSPSSVSSDSTSEIGFDGTAPNLR